MAAARGGLPLATLALASLGPWKQKSLVYATRDAEMTVKTRGVAFVSR